jgi:hypothetical protein
VITCKSSLHYLDLWAKVLKRKRSGYCLTIDAVGNKVTLKKRNHSGILWFDTTNAMFVRDMYICFRLCGDDIAKFAKHCRTVSHERLNRDLDSTPPYTIGFASQFD